MNVAAKDNKRDNRNNKRNDQTPAGGEELMDFLVGINRNAKTVKGGRKMSFTAIVVVGDGKGRVGYGTGKAKEVADARKKAHEAAIKGLVRIPLREARTIHHDVRGHSGAGKVTLRTAPSGTGVIAGGAMRQIFDALGVSDVVAKSTGSSNTMNMIQATFDALQNTAAPKLVAARRGKEVNEIVAQRAASK